MPLDFDFDLRASQAALDARRTTLGLTWESVGAELGVSAGTLRGLGTRRTAEGGGVLRALAWLGMPAARFVRVESQQPPISDSSPTTKGRTVAHRQPR